MAVILAAHPSTASVKERKPGAGLNGWGAIMRMRLWLEIVYDSQGVPTDERRLHRMKVTGARNGRIPIELVTGQGGVLVRKGEPVVEVGPFNLAAAMAAVEPPRPRGQRRPRPAAVAESRGQKLRAEGDRQSRR
jgi:hypothetical protein